MVLKCVPLPCSGSAPAGMDRGNRVSRPARRWPIACGWRDAQALGRGASRDCAASSRRAVCSPLGRAWLALIKSSTRFGAVALTRRFADSQD